MHQIDIETTERLDVVPLRLRVRVAVRPIYACRRCAEAVVLLGALAIVAVRPLGLRDAARRDGAAPADVPETTIKILAAKLQRPAEDFTTNRDFLRGVAQLVGFLARKSDGEPDWQTSCKGRFVLMIRIEGFELAQTIASPQ